MLVSELTGNDLNHWVAKARGWELVPAQNNDGEILPWNVWLDFNDKFIGHEYEYEPDTNWQQCGELIEKFKVTIWPTCRREWVANTWKRNHPNSGSTSQEAICRAVVASVYGEEVPNEQTTST